VIGSLRHRVTLQEKNQVADDAGGSTTTWSTVVTFWGRISPKSSREQSRADTLYGTSTHTLTFRTSAAPTVASTMRVTPGGNTYVIDGIPRPDERGRFSTVGLTLGVPS